METPLLLAHGVLPALAVVLCLWRGAVAGGKEAGNTRGRDDCPLPGAAGLLRRGPLLFLVPWIGLVVIVSPWLPASSAGARTAWLVLHLAGGAALLWGLGAWAFPAQRNEDGRTGGTGSSLFSPSALLAPLALIVSWGGACLLAPGGTGPNYDPAACYRFLTATTIAQSGEAAFPSALRVRPGTAPDCTESGCHREQQREWAQSAHAAAAGAAYSTSVAAFVQRRGAEAGRWCQGCHESARALHTTAPGSANRGVDCQSCHGVRAVHSLIGCAALDVAPAGEPGRMPWPGLIEPVRHRRETLVRSLHREASLCAACHRKHTNLPQNQFRWIAGTDPYREWLDSGYSGALFVRAGMRVTPKSCVDCHSFHQKAPVPALPRFRLRAFFRPNTAPGIGARAPYLLTPGRAPAFEGGYLDVIVTTPGLGHDLGGDLPGLRETWLRVRIQHGSAHTHLTSGDPGGSGRLSRDIHGYGSVPLDRSGLTVSPHAADQIVGHSPRRVIPSGGADIARYRLPRGIVAPCRLSVELLRRRAGVAAAPRVLALMELEWPGPDLPRAPEVRGARTRAPGTLGTREPEPASRFAVEAIPERDALHAADWRAYGIALASVRAYPAALAALKRAGKLLPADPETELCLGQVHLEEGDLLAARSAFGTLAARGNRSAAAWEAIVLRRMGLHEEALIRFRALAPRFPRDRRLRFEHGLALLAVLRSREALEEFDAALALDPLDSGAHYNRMVALQRLNRQPEARREEAIYRLLGGAAARSSSGFSGAPGTATSRDPLRIHELRLVQGPAAPQGSKRVRSTGQGVASPR